MSILYMMVTLVTCSEQVTYTGLWPVNAMYQLMPHVVYCIINRVCFFRGTLLLWWRYEFRNLISLSIVLFSVKLLSARGWESRASKNRNVLFVWIASEAGQKGHFYKKFLHTPPWAIMFLKHILLFTKAEYISLIFIMIFKFEHRFSVLDP